jgi:uroporphyrinogen-III synthase
VTEDVEVKFVILRNAEGASIIADEFRKEGLVLISIPLIFIKAYWFAKAKYSVELIKSA